MSGLDRMADNLANAKLLLTTLQTQADSYFKGFQANQDLQNQVERLREKGAQLRAKRQEVQNAVDAYDREFLDRQENPRRKDMYEMLGMNTTQDVALNAFAAGLILFSISVLSYAVIMSPQKMSTFVVMLFMLAALMFISLTLIVRYG